MKPVNDYLLIYPEKKEVFRTTASGVIYELNKPSEPVKDPIVRGRVSRIGDTVNKNMISDIKIEEGDLVTYYPLAATQIIYEKETVHLVSVKDLVTLIK